MNSGLCVVGIAMCASVVLAWPSMRPLVQPVMGIAPAELASPWEGALARDMSFEGRNSPRGRLLVKSIQQLLHGGTESTEEAVDALAECIGEESDEIAWRAASSLAEALMGRRTSTPRLVSNALVKGLCIRPSRVPESERELLAAWEPLLHEALGAGTRWERGSP